MKHIYIYIRDFKYEIQNYVLSSNQLKIFDILNNYSIGLHVFKGTLGSGIFFFLKYFTHYFQTQNKNLLLIAKLKLLLYNYHNMLALYILNSKY